MRDTRRHANGPAIGRSEVQESSAGSGASYGIDAPYLLVIPVLLIALGIVQGIVTGRIWPFLGAAMVLVCVSLGLYASRRGKFLVWSRVLDDLAFAGGERVLDLGCGTGAILLLAARRLSSGRAVGIDVWRGSDQSGNRIEQTRRNARAEDVSDRVELHTAEMTSLPFNDQSFDVVISNIALHNVKTRAGRERAIDEAVRVLRPGGRVVLADLCATAEYRARLAALGLKHVGSRNLGWRMWWSGPWLATRLVTATKPQLPDDRGPASQSATTTQDPSVRAAATIFEPPRV